MWKKEKYVIEKTLSKNPEVLNQKANWILLPSRIWEREREKLPGTWTQSQEIRESGLACTRISSNCGREAWVQEEDGQEKGQNIWEIEAEVRGTECLWEEENSVSNPSSSPYEFHTSSLLIMHYETTHDIFYNGTTSSCSWLEQALVSCTLNTPLLWVNQTWMYS